MNRRDHDPFAPMDELDTTEPHAMEGDGIEKTAIDASDGETHTLTVEKPATKPKTSRRKPAAKPKETQHVPK